MNILSAGRVLRKSHEKTHSWDKTGKAFNITGGMAFRIAINGYDPANPQTRKALGLGLRICPKCKKHFLKSVIRVATPKIGTPGWLAYYLKLPFKEIK